MPSTFKARAGRPSLAEMKADLDALRKPTAARMEQLFSKYHELCLSSTPARKEIEVKEEGVNWKALIMSLPDYSKVLGCGIRKILLCETECVYEGVYRFHVERRDGSRASFDFKHAYDDAYHGYKDKSFVHDVELALRAAVLSQLIQYKEMLAKDSQMELVSAISGVALPWERAVVQNYPTPFNEMVTRFLVENQVKMEHVQLEYDNAHAYRIKSQQLRDRWIQYHRTWANYRIISTNEAMDLAPPDGHGL